MNWDRIKVLASIFMICILQSCSDEESPGPNVPGSDRDKFVGDWLCKETVTGNAPTTFTISIQKHGSEDTLYVYNFNNIGSPFYAVWLVSSNSVTIPAQTISQVDVSGSGIYGNDKINLSYTSDGESATALCTH